MARRPVPTLLATALAITLGGSFFEAHAIQSIPATRPAPDAIETARRNPDVLILQAGIFDPGMQRLDPDSVGVQARTPDAFHAIVQFESGKLKAGREALRALGAEFLGYVPNNAYYVRLNGVSADTLRKQAGVRWIGPIEPAMKLDSSLWRARRLQSTTRQRDGQHEIIVHAFAGISSEAIAARILAQVPGARVTMRSQRADQQPYVRLSGSMLSINALIEAAVAIEGVYLVAPWIESETTNSASISAIQANNTGDCSGSGSICGPTPLFDHGLTGTGQIVAVADSGTTPNAAWFTTLDTGRGQNTAITFAQNPPPIPPALGTLYPNNKIIAYWTQPGGPVDYDFTSGHGTHVTGTVLGDAAGTFGANTYTPSTPSAPNHDLADGMAPNAQLLMQDAGPTSATSIIIQDFEATLIQAHDAGARIHNNSWGAKTAGQYSGNDSSLDRATFDHEAMLVVVAAGNDVAGANATGSPGNAKNALTVAALGHGGSLSKASYSNAGPAADGRQKPDLAAPGSSIISARNGSSVNGTITAPVTIGNSGTSMATPTVSGQATLVRQYFADGLYPRGYRHLAPLGNEIFADGFEAQSLPRSGSYAVDAYEPGGALLKAVLLNSTVPTTSPSTMPNSGTGWGRPWLDGNLWFNQTLAGGNDDRRLRIFERNNVAGLETGDVNEFVIGNVGSGQEFRATLAWFDAEALAGAASALVNNLDLEVVAPNGTTYRGNVFSGSVSVAGGSADTRDTVEQVRFTAPLAGSYTIRVKATAVPGNGRPGTDRQGYGLAVSGRFGLPDPIPFPAPTAPSVASNGVAGVGITASTSPGAQGYQLYRAAGSCSIARTGDFHLVANGSSLPLVDHRTQGGYAYAYTLRGIQNDVEGLVSGCIGVVSQDACTLTPDFASNSLGSDAAHANCAVTLDWAAAQSNCPAATAISYRLERDSTPYFNAPTVLDANLASTSFSDATVANGTAYFYRVRASDAAGNDAPWSAVVNATPSGADGPDPGSFLDDADSHSYLAMTPPWRVTNAAASNGSLSYRSSADGQPYPNNTCASITTPPLTLTAGATLSYKARYNLEYQWDGVVQEISTDGGASWTPLPPDGGFPSSFAQTTNPPVNACAYPSTQGAFSGVSTTTSNADSNNNATAVFKPFTTTLASYAGQTVMLRWRFSSDPAASYEGFSIDEIKIQGAPGSGNHVCTP